MPIGFAGYWRSCRSKAWTFRPAPNAASASCAPLPGLKMPDCCLLDTARYHNAAIATFDDKLAAQAADLALTVATIPR